MSRLFDPGPEVRQATPRPPSPLPLGLCVSPLYYGEPCVLEWKTNGTHITRSCRRCSCVA